MKIALKNLFQILFAVVVLAAAFLIFRSFKKEPKPNIEKIVRDTVTVVKTDTIFITIYKTVEIEKPVIREVIRNVSVDYDSLDYIRTYSDTARIDSTNLSFYYNALVTGYLDNINFGLIGSMPIQRTTITETVTESNYIDPTGFYLISSFNTSEGLGFGGQYLRKRFVFQYQYHLSKSHSLGVGVKLF